MGRGTGASTDEANVTHNEIGAKAGKAPDTSKAPLLRCLKGALSHFLFLRKSNCTTFFGQQRNSF
jgi:hypothetical protein